MDSLVAIGYFLVLWGLGTFYVAVIRPEKIWKLGKIQGFVQLLGDRTTSILFTVLGLVALIAGIWLIR